MHCEICGKDNQDQGSFCTGCGSKRPEGNNNNSKATTISPNKYNGDLFPDLPYGGWKCVCYETENKDSAKFCVACGQPRYVAPPKKPIKTKKPKNLTPLFLGIIAVLLALNVFLVVLLFGQTNTGDVQDPGPGAADLSGAVSGLTVPADGNWLTSY